ncbi:MAG: hypothetical protein P8M53_09730 [Pirellulales bacterium]|nr:hypothetical protein [Pirellulales bacterium]
MPTASNPELQGFGCVPAGPEETFPPVMIRNNGGEGLRRNGHDEEDQSGQKGKRAVG